MSNLIKQKQVENLGANLSAKANAADVLNKTNSLSDVSSISAARNNLNVHSKEEVNSMVAGAGSAKSVANLTERNALTGLSVSDRVFVSNDGDGKWALYIVENTTDGIGSNTEFVKISDEDLFANAMSAAAVKSAYESNSNTNAFSDSEKTKLAHISVSQSVNLDTMESTISSNTSAASSAQSTANSALSAANTAQSTANNKEDSFTETKESFSGLASEPNADIDITLTRHIKAGFEVLVFFGTLMVENIAWTAGTTNVRLNVPYPTDESDVIYVIYKY